MFDWIVMNVIKTGPIVFFTTNTGIPIAIPDLPTLRIVEQVNGSGSSSMQLTDELADVSSILRLDNDVIMVFEHNPSANGNPKF